jgi:MFS family permease
MGGKEVMQSCRNGPGFFYGYFIVTAAFLIMLVMYSLFYSFGVFFKPMLNEFGWSRAMTSGAFSLSSTMLGLLAIVMGGLTDKFGPRVVLTFCGFLSGLGYFLMSGVSAAWQLYLFFGVIVGAGMGGSFIPLATTVARWFVEKRATMTGIVAAGIGIGTLFGPPVAHRLISAYGWRLSYVILGSVVLVGVVLSAQLLRRDPAQVGHVAYGMVRGEENGSNSEDEGLSLKKAAHTWQFWMVSAMFFCVGFCVFSVMVHIVPHAMELGISAASGANIVATIGGLSIVGKVAFGRVADKIGSRKTFMIGLILMSGALLWLVPAKMVWRLYLFAGVFGLAYGGCVTAQSPLIAALFGLGSHGLIFGLTNVNFMFGGALGSLVNGYVFDVTGSYRFALFGCAVLSLVGVALTAALRRTDARE